MSDKQAIRARMLAARAAMAADEREAADRALVAKAVEIVRGSAIAVVYAPMRGEPGGAGLVDALAAVVGTLLLPILLPDLDLDWVVYEPGGRTDLRREPAGRALGVAAIGSAEVVLVPAVAVDRAGTRLGRGGGSYDRALARVGCATPVIALLYSDELLDSLPREPHDRPVGAVLTPNGLHHTQGHPTNAL